MYIIYSNAMGKRVEGIVLASSSDRMRIVVPKSGDVEELRKVEGEWVSENGHRVTIESLISAEAQVEKARTFSAGSNGLS